MERIFLFVSFLNKFQEEIVYCEGDEALSQVAQRSCGIIISLLNMPSKCYCTVIFLHV